MPSVSKAAAAAAAAGVGGGPSGSPPQTEKPTHYRYLKEFRTEQCPLFLQHKCAQHRPFTCFHWHFLNQRRRRPIRRRDGTFNYSPDVYCTKYDETTGVCPAGDGCPYLHRTTGDTERKYHLRYYKTGTCIHETDARGHCMKNGFHCAFAHGPLDLRPPVYDIRELQAQEALQNGQLGSGESPPDLQPGVLASQAMIEKIIGEDPRWQDTNFVLGGYKTEQCTKPPRLCRQGYACPHYHNSRDRRRNPRKFKYRSTPCPNVKHGDEWGEPSKCESGDNCQYCHSRTEQQFHPEIYKSTKCNDMRQTGYCPRGPFCAFAHVEKDPLNVVMMPTGGQPKPAHLFSAESIGIANDWNCHDFSSSSNNGQPSNISCSNNPAVTSSAASSSPLSPIGPPCRQRSLANGALCSDPTTSVVSSPTSSYPKAPGFEREDQAKQRSLSNESNQKISEQDNKQSHHSVFAVADPLASSVTSSITSSLASSIGSDSSNPTTLSAVNPKALPFCPSNDMVEPVIGEEQEDPESGDLSVTSQRLLGSSAPVNIPGCLARSPSLHSPSSVSTSPLGSLPPRQPQPQHLKPEAGAPGPPTAAPHNSLGLNGVTGSIWDFVSGNFSPSPSPILSPGTAPAGGAAPDGAGAGAGGELARVRWELDEAKRKIKQWENSWQQVKQACDAWQREAREAKERAKLAATDKQLALQKKDEVESQLRRLQEELEGLGLGPGSSRGSVVKFPALRGFGDMEKIPLAQLHSLQNQLRLDLEALDRVIFQLRSKKCTACHERDRTAVLQPCQHYVLCEHCAAGKPECPYCPVQPARW
ncbi:putative E3 ubiquitin-protein ligase UNKL [Tachyglossus aculeatus]|uniref:putative E3 ubiquitin-protein ligase UNKL n=1 Tax=Tachyglossus aculeatus TaxID=9261 RepID=UPI0018F30FA4|nr:putative E3 ubiquitin-protein ligase UNKL [Tachyglossus aculeatus]